MYNTSIGRYFLALYEGREIWGIEFIAGEKTFNYIAKFCKLEI